MVARIAAASHLRFQSGCHSIMITSMKLVREFFFANAHRETVIESHAVLNSGSTTWRYYRNHSALFTVVSATMTKVSKNAPISYLKFGLPHHILLNVCVHNGMYLANFSLRLN